MSKKNKRIRSKQISEHTKKIFKKPIDWMFGIRNVAPAQDSTQHILNILDDDCIYEIFRKFSRIEDVMSMGLVCQKFQENAKRCIRTEFKCCIEINGRNRYSRKFWKSKRTEESLSIFGSMIHSISYSYSWQLSASDDDYIFRSIAKFCGKTLKVLRLGCSRPNFDQTQFQALEQLFFIFCEPKNFKSESSLKFLSITEYKLNWIDKYMLGIRYKPWYIQKMPSLKHIQFFDTMKLTEDNLIKFMTSNPQLQKLEISSENVSTSVLKHIAQCLPNLLNLHFHELTEITNHQVNENIMYCSKLRRLEDFELFVKNNSISPEIVINMFAENDIPIERLSVDVFKNVGPCDNMLTLKTLQHLEIYNSNGKNIDELLINIVKTQIALKTIYVDQTPSTPSEIQSMIEQDLSQLKYKTDETKIYLKNDKSIVSLCRGRNKIIRFHDGEINFAENILNTNSKWSKFDTLDGIYSFFKNHLHFQNLFKPSNITNNSYKLYTFPILQVLIYTVDCLIPSLSHVRT